VPHDFAPFLSNKCEFELDCKECFVYVPSETQIFAAQAPCHAQCAACKRKKVLANGGISNSEDIIPDDGTPEG